METVFIALVVVVSLLLILVVMVQNPKGGGLSSSFGGGSSNVVGGVRNTGSFLDRSTWTLATLLVVLILLSNVFIKGSGFSEVEDIDEEVTPNTEISVEEDTGKDLPATEEDDKDSGGEASSDAEKSGK